MMQEHRQGCQTAETSSRRSPNHGSGSIAGVQELLLALIEEFLLMVLRRVQSLPQQVDVRLCTFKDALDRDFKIDPTLIVDWEACYSPISITFCVAIDDDNQIFELILCDTFGRASGARGVQRIRDQMYRLHDATTEQVVIPDRGRAFARVFTPGRHLRMSMYFYENEMSTEGCPACGQPRPRTGRRWTICPACDHRYQLEEDIPAQSRRNRANIASRKTYGPWAAPDLPGFFAQVTIGKALSLPISTGGGGGGGSRSEYHLFSQSLSENMPSVTKSPPPN
ncbi:hypothetical protein Slin15195_G068510 [Septoria linicola]|uniref:Uncharacterized protein n=1 Tax=Septoria linicola TaxID=215465 RepID=A0A9Q9AX31_9PEZI|nr:hypothetical protein Slin15195_G068510 [Septoria linicola]